MHTNPFRLPPGSVVEPHGAHMFRKGDTVKLSGNRGPETAIILAAQFGAAVLETPLGGFYNWNYLDLEKVASNG